jgi:hypothetical protein
MYNVYYIYHICNIYFEIYAIYVYYIYIHVHIYYIYIHVMYASTSIIYLHVFCKKSSSAASVL